MKIGSIATWVASSCLGLLFAFQVAALVRCQTPGFGGYSERYFCWAANDQLAVYSTRVIVEGRELSPDEIYRRYSDRPVAPVVRHVASGSQHRAWNSVAFQQIIDRIDSYETTHADRAEYVEVTYELNGRKGVWVPMIAQEHRLSPAMTLLARLITINFVLHADAAGRTGIEQLPLPHLPMWKLLLPLEGSTAFQMGLRLAAIAASALILGTSRVRAGAVLLGSVMMTALVASAGSYMNHRIFAAVILLIIGLSPGATAGKWVRVQLVLVYSGAFLSKLLDADWRDGQFMQAWLDFMAETTAHPQVFATVRGMLVSHHVPIDLLISIFTIVTEGALALLLVSRRTRLPALVVGVMFHSSLTSFHGWTFGMFFFNTFVCFALLYIEGAPASQRMTRSARLLDYGLRNQRYVLAAGAGLVVLARNHATIAGLVAIALTIAAIAFGFSEQRAAGKWRSRVPTFRLGREHSERPA